jgi:hypothetical protein
MNWFREFEGSSKTKTIKGNAFLGLFLRLENDFSLFE